MNHLQRELRRYYDALYSAWGPQHWWPAQSRFEVIVGAILTQSTSWTNVELALANLRRNGALTIGAIREISVGELEQLIRPAGYFRQKSARLKAFVSFLDSRHPGSLNRMFSVPTQQLRAELLSINGIGPETADSILLYAGNHPVFVVDAYARRIVERHGLFLPNAKYEAIRVNFEQALQAEADMGVKSLSSGDRPPAHVPSRVSSAARSSVVQRLNDMHALIVQAGKHFCLAGTARCEHCPLRHFLPENRPVMAKSAAPVDI